MQERVIPSSSKLIGIFLRLKLRRLWNSRGALFKRGPKAPAREGTPIKSSGLGIFPILILIFLAISTYFLANGAMTNIRSQFHGTVFHNIRDTQAHDVTYEVFNEVRPLHAAYGLYLAGALLFAVLISISGREITKTEWDLEWLCTLPISRHLLLFTRVMERSLFSYGSLYLIFGVAYLWDPRAIGVSRAILLGFFASLPLLFLNGAIQVALDTGLRVRLSPLKLKNIQAASSIFATVLTFYLINLRTIVPSGFLSLAEYTQPLILALPTGQITRAIYGIHQKPIEWASMAIYILSTLALTAIAFLGCLRLIREGVVSEGMRSSNRKAAQPLVLKQRQFLQLSPLVARELRQLARDRNYLIQTFAVPVLFVLFGSLNRSGLQLNTPALYFGTTFYMTGYMILLSGSRILGSEGGALWILSALPLKLETIVLKKASFWRNIGWALVAASLLYGGLTLDFQWRELIWRAVASAVGIAIFSLLICSLEVLSFQAHTEKSQTKLKVSHAYFFMTLQFGFAYAIWSDDYWQAVVIISLISATAYSFWQRARIELPFIHDPSSRQKPGVYLSDGLVSVLLFLMFQLGFSWLLKAKSDLSPQTVIFYAFGASGALCWASLRLHFFRLKLETVPKFLWSGRWKPVLLYGSAGGCVTALIGIAYSWFVQKEGWLPEPIPSSYIDNTPHWLGTLGAAVLLAPIFEEFIFRGVVFTGLLQSVSVNYAIPISAFIFASIHPRVSFVPVFALGCATAWIYRRMGSLVAPAITHGIYNLCLFLISVS